MTRNELITRVLLKVIIYALVILGVSFIGDILMPVADIDVAMDQLENSDAAFMAMQAYERFKVGYACVSGGITLVFAASILYDFFKFVKPNMNNTENIKEN